MDLHPEPPCLAVCKRPGSRPEKSWTGMDAHGLNIMESLSDYRFVLSLQIAKSLQIRYFILTWKIKIGCCRTESTNRYIGKLIQIENRNYDYFKSSRKVN